MANPDRVINQTHDSSLNDIHAPVQILRLEGGENLRLILWLAVGMFFFLIILTAIAMFALFTALQASTDVERMRQQYSRDVAEYRNAADAEATWRRQVQNTLVVRGILDDPIPARKRN